MVAIAMAVLFIPSAFAVHDTGVFQLDGNADQSVATGYPNATEDWSAICKANPTTCTAAPGSDVSSAPATTAEKSTFITDAFNAGSDNIFKGGTDDADLSTWQWKQATPSPNKADLEHAYAAQYQIPNNGSSEAGHQVLFFGGDRYANNGDTNIGLWFFHKPVTTGGTNTNADGTCTKASGCGFTGVHTCGNISLGHATTCNGVAVPQGTPGDLFILSAFTGGGAEPTIKIFEWVGPGNATKDYLGSNNCFTNACTLQPLAIPNTPGFSDNRCATSANAVTNDQACAIVNSAAVNSPWTFQDQSSGAPANRFGTNEFYEGGLDLTHLGFENACFSSVLLNTRSSQSGTSVLQDFALGNFGGCGSTLVTTPSAGKGGSVDLPPTSTTNPSSVTVTDSAHLTVTGTSTFSGTLSFHLCGPESASATDSCSTGGASAGSQTVTANGDYTSSTMTLTEAGRYCWRGDFVATSPSDLTGSSDSSTDECFTVNPVTPTISTHVDSAGPVTIGNAIGDTATLSGTANEPGTGGVGSDGSINPGTDGAVAGGTITFKVYGPDDSTCGGTVLKTLTASVAGDSSASNVYHVSFTPTSAGTYRFVASYGGDLPNTKSRSGACNDANELVVVSPKQPTISTTQTAGPLPLGSSISDTATLGNTANKPDGTAAGGTIQFFAYGPQADPLNPVCNSGDLVYTSAAYAVSGDGTYPTPSQATAGFIPTAPGQYNWVAVYSGDLPNTLDVSSNCADEASLIISLQPTMDTSQFFYPNDSARIRVASGAGDLTGNVRFQLFDNADCSDPANHRLYDSGTIDITSGTGTGLDRTVKTSNTTVKVDVNSPSLSLSWLVTYTSGKSGIKNVTSACHNENSSLTIDNGTQSNTP